MSYKLAKALNRAGLSAAVLSIWAFLATLYGGLYKWTTISVSDAGWCAVVVVAVLSASLAILGCGLTTSTYPAWASSLPDDRRRRPIRWLIRCVGTVLLTGTLAAASTYYAMLVLTPYMTGKRMTTKGVVNQQLETTRVRLCLRFVTVRLSADQQIRFCQALGTRPMERLGASYSIGQEVEITLKESMLGTSVVDMRLVSR